MASSPPVAVSDAALQRAEQYVEEEEGAANRLKGWLGGSVRLAAFVMAAFHLYTAYAIVPTQTLRPVHVAFVLFLCFLVFPVARRFRHRVMWWDWLAAALAVAVAVYAIQGGDDFTDRNTSPNPWDIAFGVALIALVLEAMRRTSGWVMPVVTFAFLVYAMAGPWLPAPWTHKGYEIGRLVGVMYMTLEGIFGTAVDVSSTLIILFNMLPAFPMDGGRVFRAALSPVVGRDAATRIAVIVGEVFATALLVFSLVVIQSIILALLALFIMVVAYAEDRAVRVESAMRRLRVGQFALWDMGGIAPGQPLANALRGGPRDIAVTQDGRVVGMLWRNSLLAALGKTGAGRMVADVMERSPRTVDIDMPIYEVQRLMIEEELAAVPVTEDGTYRGVFTRDRFLHVYRQVTPDPWRMVREVVDQRRLERMRV